MTYKFKFWWKGVMIFAEENHFDDYKAFIKYYKFKNIALYTILYNFDL